MFFKRAIVKFYLFMDSVNFTPKHEDSWYVKAFLLDQKWKTGVISDEGGYL